MQPRPSHSNERLPAPLRAIYEELDRPRPDDCNLEGLKEAWQSVLAQARAHIPGICIESEGEIVHLGRLSPGCEACKAGTWDCIFTTMRCNLNCEFCYSPQAIPESYTGSVFGSTPGQIAENHDRTNITGVSFSGGEPFLEPRKLLSWVAWFKDHYSEKYTWVYTNGVLAEEGVLQELGKLGLDEIRFNTAATSYNHPAVMKNLALAAEFIPNVTVEIPAIPEHAAKLFSSLQDWSSRGVKFLNLHELIYEPGTLSASMTGARQPAVLADGHRTAFNPDSRLLTFAVMKKVSAENLPLAVNDCSLQSKLLQIRGRRRALSALTREPYEKLVGDEALESLCIYRNEQEYQFCNPDTFQEVRARYPDYKLVKIVREAPLTLKGKNRWIAVKEY